MAGSANTWRKILIDRRSKRAIACLRQLSSFAWLRRIAAISSNKRVHFIAGTSPKATIMRCIPVFYLLLLFNCYEAAGQVLPASSGSCRVSPSGVEGCHWMTGVKSSKLLVTRYVLAPGAPLTPPRAGREALIVGTNNGELVNEKKSPPSHVNVSNGSVMLMPKEEPYLLRNIGKDNLELLVIEVRK